MSDFSRPAVQMVGVSKQYNGHRALNELSLEVPAGATFGLVGPNGAGKTSAMRIALGIMSHDGGEVRLLGGDPRQLGATSRVGYLPEERGLYRNMPITDLICFFAGLKGVARAEARRRANRWLESMGLAKWSRLPLESLSKGMQQKVQLIVALVHEPELLVLDEPASGLDPINAQLINEVVKQAREGGRTLIFSSHDLEEVERTCDFVCVVAAGRVVVQGPVKDILRSDSQSSYLCELAEGSQVPPQAGLPIGPVRSISRRGESWRIDVSSGARVVDALAHLAQIGVQVAAFHPLRPTLREVFMREMDQQQLRSRSL